MAAPTFRRLIFPSLPAGGNWLGADAGRGRLGRHGVTAQRAAGRGGRELDGQELGQTAEPGPRCVPCEPTLVVAPAARGRRAGAGDPGWAHR
jgi:hypothetical protein